MKILFSSHLFPPSIGGIESVGLMLAEAFSELGHPVRVVTQTEAQAERKCAFEILRRPTARELYRSVSWCDVVFQNNISLQTAWPLLFQRRPWVVAHHTWIARPDGSLRWPDHAKRLGLRFATSVAISRAIADSLPVASVIIPDPYDERVFRELPEATRDRELIFVGRLVSDKGADVLLNAVELLRHNGLRPQLTIVGDGPERPALQQHALATPLHGQVEFVGWRVGEALARLLNQHQILVVPSRWQEPFGIVALEGIACGCVVAGSSGGGLPEAIGPCGRTFPNGDAAALAEILADLLCDPAKLKTHRASAREHLAAHQRMKVAKAYLAVLQQDWARVGAARAVVPHGAPAHAGSRR